MKNCWSTVAVIAALSSIASAQQTRYRDQVFAAANVQSDIQYGSAVNRYTQRTEQLMLDLYTPRGDTSTSRAVVVVVHGGGFHTGSKSDPQYVKLADDYARRGYVSISIDYRLRPTSGSTTHQTMIDAAHDFKASVRWLRKNATSLGIDTNRIACTGGSAGGTTILEAGYGSAGEGSSGNPGYSSETHTIANLWGHLYDPSELSAGEQPLIIVHGTNDPVVPYQKSVMLAARAAAVGVVCELLPVQGASHAPWGQYFTSFHTDSVGFLYEHLLLGQVSGLNAKPGYSSPGNLTIGSFGVAGDTSVMFVAAGSANIPLGQLGVFCLDPTTTIVLPPQALPATPRISSVTTNVSVPAGLTGLSVFWQALHAPVVTSPRWLTNCVQTTF